MYGMVNNAFRHYVIEREDEAAWDAIVAEAKLETAEFGAMLPYDDSVTLAIVGAMIKRSGREIDELLQDVGSSWVSFAKTTPFANLLAMAGQDFATVVANLDAMHARIQSSLATMQPPSFTCQAREGGLFDVTYKSEREGLFPFVLGIFQGLAAHFDQKVEVHDFDQLSPSSATWTLRLSAVTEQAA